MGRNVSASGVSAQEAPSSTTTTVKPAIRFAGGMVPNWSFVNLGDPSYGINIETDENMRLVGDVTIPSVIVCDFSKMKSFGYMFSSQYYMESITLPAGFAKNAVDCTSMFDNCVELKTIGLPADFASNPACDMTSCFGSTALTTWRVLPIEFFVNHTGSLAYMFAGTAITSDIVLPEGFASKSLDVSAIISNGNGTGSITYNSDFGKAAINASGLFMGRRTMTSVVVPNHGWAKLTGSIANAFQGCSALTSVVLPAGFGDRVSNMVRLFAQCTALQSVTFPTGFGTKVAQAFSGASGMFIGCANLTTINGDLALSANFDLSPCTKLTHDSLMNVLNSIQTVTAKRTLKLGSTNLAKLTAAEKKVATDKGWTLA